MNLTKENPGCFSELIYALADDNAESIFKVIDLKIKTVTELPRIKKRNGKTPLEYNLRHCAGIFEGKVFKFYEIRTDTGNVKVLVTDKGEFDVGEIFDTIVFWSHKQLTEFKSYSKLKLVGTYKDSLGNGYYSKVNLYEFNGQ